MDDAEFNYPALDSSSEEGELHEEEEDDGDHYALDVSSVESPVRTPILNDTSNSNANDTQVVVCDAPPQSPEINLYDDLIGENPQESDQLRIERQEAALVECQRIIESLRTQVDEEQRKVKRLGKSLHMTLATSRKDSDRSKQTIDDLKQRSQRLVAVCCPSCQLGFDASSSPTCRPRPISTRVLRGQCVVELKFGNYEALRSWVLAADLDTNTDGLPTLPESLALTLQPAKPLQPATLASSGSRLVRPLEKPTPPLATVAEEKGENRNVSPVVRPNDKRNADPSPPVSLDNRNYRIPRKRPISPLRSEHDDRYDRERRRGRKDDAGRVSARRCSRSRSRERYSRRSRSRSRSRERKRPRRRSSSHSKRSRSPRSWSPRSSRSPRRSRHPLDDRQRRRERVQQRKEASPKRSPLAHKSQPRKSLSSPKVSASASSNQKALLPNRMKSGSAQKLDSSTTDGQRKRLRSCTDAATRKDPVVDALSRPSLPITPVPQLPACRTAEVIMESPASKLPDGNDRDHSLDHDLTREVLRTVLDLSPQLSPVKPLTPRINTPLRSAMTTPSAAARCKPTNERRTVSPLKIRVRPQVAGKGRMSGKLAAMLLMQMQDEAAGQISEDNEISEDEATDENDGTTAVDSCASNVRLSAGADRTNIWMNSLRKNLQL